MIMKEKNETGYVFERENGDLLRLSYAEVRNLKVALELDQLKVLIHSITNELDGDRIAVGSLDMRPDEFEDEVFDSLQYAIIDDSGFPTDEYIEERILDTADDYGILIDD